MPVWSTSYPHRYGYDVSREEDALTAQTAPITDLDTPVVDEPVAQLVEEDTLVEEVSIDGMCGVY